MTCVAGWTGYPEREHERWERIYGRRKSAQLELKVSKNKRCPLRVDTQVDSIERLEPMFGKISMMNVLVKKQNRGT